MRHFSLSQRIKIAYIVSFVLLSLLSMLLVFASTKLIEDNIFEKQLTHKIDSYQQQVQQGLTPQLPANITIYNTPEQLPDQLGQYLDMSVEGIAEINHPNDLDYHYAIIRQPNKPQLIFLFDVNNVEISEEIEQQVMQYMFLGFALLLLLFFIIFNLIIKRALAPMYQLINQINASKTTPELTIKNQYPNDNELGLLNQTLVDYSQRIDAFIQREREFTSFASHELRTPVTIIKGALALLQMSNTTDKNHKPLARIERASQSMEDTIEVFLSLSREQHRIDSQKVNLAEIVRQVVANLSNKLEANNKQLNTSHKTDHSAQQHKVEKIPAELVITNLLTNAIRHSDTAQINLQLQANHITITNQIQPNHQQTSQAQLGYEKGYEQGYGLGLIIVERICQQQNWQFSHQKTATEYRADVVFSNQ